MGRTDATSRGFSGSRGRRAAAHTATSRLRWLPRAKRGVIAAAVLALLAIVAYAVVREATTTARGVIPPQARPVSKPPKPAFTPAEEAYIRALWPIHGDVERSTVRLSLGQIFYKINDMDRTRKVYGDVLGFKVEGESGFAADSAMQALTGLPSLEVRRSRVQANGSALWIEFVEYKGVDRTPLRMRIQDRGAARLQLRTQNIDAMVKAVKGAGLTVVSHGAVAVPIPPNFMGALVADPNNFFVSLFEPCDGCAPRTPTSTASR